MTDACGVDEAEGDAAELDGVFDGITSGALDVTDDGTFFAQQGIEERGFADIGCSDYGNGNAVLDGVASMEGVGKAGDVVINLLCQFQEFGTVGKFEVLMVGEVKFQFKERGEFQ